RFVAATHARGVWAYTFEEAAHPPRILTAREEAKGSTAAESFDYARGTPWFPREPPPCERGRSANSFRSRRRLSSFRRLFVCGPPAGMTRLRRRIVALSEVGNALASRATCRRRRALPAGRHTTTKPLEARKPPAAPETAAVHRRPEGGGSWGNQGFTHAVRIRGVRLGIIGCG